MITYKVEKDTAVITEVTLNQAVTAQDQAGKTINVEGAKRDITTTYSITKEQAQLQVIQLTKQKNEMTAFYAKRIADIDVQLKLLKEIVEAIV